MGFVDAHSHVWTDETGQYPLASGFTREDLRPVRFPPEELLSHAWASGVDRVVLIQFSAHGTDNSYILDCARLHRGTFSVVAVVDHEGGQPEREMLSLAERGARGFRIRPGPAPADAWLDGEGLTAMFRVASRHSLAICPLINPDALPALERRCAQFPDAPVVIDHMARVGINEPVREEQLSLLCGMARFPRVAVKVSAFYAFGSRRPPYADAAPLVKRLVEAFGPRRLMWGSDCPFQLAGASYDQSIAVVRDGLPFLSPEDREWMLGRTAESLFFPGS